MVWYVVNIRVYCDICNKDVIRTGITNDKDVVIGALIMIFTSFTYFIVQGVAFVYLFQGNPESKTAQAHEKWFALACAIICCILFLLYSIFRVVNGKLQERQMALAKEDAANREMLEKWRTRILTAFEVKGKSNPLLAALSEPAANKKPVSSVNEETTAVVDPTPAPVVNISKFANKWKKKTFEKDTIAEETQPILEKQSESVKVEAKVDDDGSSSDDEEGEKKLTLGEKLKIIAQSVMLLGVGLFLHCVLDNL